MKEEGREYNPNFPEETFKEDLEKYRQLALELGADETVIISSDQVVLDERVLARCISPMCPYYKTNLHCPPYGMKMEETRRLVEAFRWGVFIMHRVPAEEQTGKDYYEADKHRLPGAIKMYKIVAKVQSAAFYDGYPLAMAFSGGPCCKRVFCPNVECRGLRGEGCRFGHKVTPTMHSVGMDVFKMAARAGWKIYPIGWETRPDQIPYGLEMGLVLVD